MNNTEKLATQAAQDEENRDNTICVGYYYAKANTKRRSVVDILTLYIGLSMVL
jgi:hypothetical protein